MPNQTRSQSHPLGSLALGLLSTVLTIGLTSPAVAQLDFDQCGVLVQGFECMVFLPDDGGSYQIENLDGSMDGDYVRVIGTLDSACTSFCFLPCVVDNTTTECLPLGTTFVRGDTNGDGSYDISDPIHLVQALFVPTTPESPCHDAADANDDGTESIADVVYLLSDLFAPDSPPIPSPHPTCGIDPTADGLSCLDYDACP